MALQSLIEKQSFNLRKEVRVGSAALEQLRQDWKIDSWKSQIIGWQMQDSSGRVVNATPSLQFSTSAVENWRLLNLSKACSNQKCTRKQILEKVRLEARRPTAMVYSGGSRNEEEKLDLQDVQKEEPAGPPTFITVTPPTSIKHLIQINRTGWLTGCLCVCWELGEGVSD